MTLHQGLNRQIRRMCRDLHLTILRLVRVAQGPLRLGVMKPGEARELTPAEVAAARKKLWRCEEKIGGGKLSKESFPSPLLFKGFRRYRIPVRRVPCR